MCALEQQKGRAVRRGLSGCRKSPGTFSTAFKNAVTFAPHSGAKVLAPLPGSLAQQGFRGIRFHARRAAAPSRSPAPTRADSAQPRFFDSLSRGHGPRLFLTPKLEYYRIFRELVHNYLWKQRGISMKNAGYFGEKGIVKRGGSVYTRQYKL